MFFIVCFLAFYTFLMATNMLNSFDKDFLIGINTHNSYINFCDPFPLRGQFFVNYIYRQVQSVDTVMKCQLSLHWQRIQQWFLNGKVYIKV